MLIWQSTGQAIVIRKEVLLCDNRKQMKWTLNLITFLNHRSYWTFRNMISIYVLLRRDTLITLMNPLL